MFPAASLGDLIPDFDPYTMKSRQRLLALVFLKELYDNREKYQKDSKGVSNAVASMLLKEIYKGGIELRSLVLRIKLFQVQSDFLHLPTVPHLEHNRVL